jgi:predicted O-methyltransferase YrrM
MALTYKCDDNAIELAMTMFKDDGLVAQDAYLNHEASRELRREVAYRDFDFLSRLGRVAEVETVRSVLAWLQQEGVAPEEAEYDESAFGRFRSEVKAAFEFSGTSITPVMERLLYALSAVRRPRRVIGIGTYMGNALVWSVGASCGRERLYQAERVYGIDVDAGATEQARANFARLTYSDHIELVAEDGLKVLEDLDGPFDCVLLDADARDTGKGIYLEVLEAVYEKLEPGAWVLAHDDVVPRFAGRLEGYLSLVRDGTHFSQSVLFDVDAFGLELSIR